MARWSDTHDCRRQGHILHVERGHLVCVQCRDVVPTIESAPDVPGRSSVGWDERMAFKARMAEWRREGRVA